ncbi:MAG: 2-C-methyl-D-erythritol 4-phosphate cytidylyltransferase [Pseudomonadota bacterium]
MKNYAIIVSGGQGRRMGTTQKKQYLCLEKVPVLCRTILAFDQCNRIDQIILVIPKDDHQYCKENIIAPLNLSRMIHLVDGGKHRQDSVLNGLKKVEELIASQADAMVLIHDGVRPFVDHTIINDCIDRATDYGACIPGVKLTDTIKQANCDSYIEKTLDRDVLFSAQTPQVFKFQLLLRAFAHARQTGFSGTDDASLVEHLGHPVYITKGSKLNIKITTQDDMILASQILRTANIIK